MTKKNEKKTKQKYSWEFTCKHNKTEKNSIGVFFSSLLYALRFSSGWSVFSLSFFALHFIVFFFFDRINKMKIVNQKGTERQIQRQRVCVRQRNRWKTFFQTTFKRFSQNWNREMSIYRQCNNLLHTYTSTHTHKIDEFEKAAEGKQAYKQASKQVIYQSINQSNREVKRRLW